MNEKKRHHFVWQKYLKNWSQNDKICTYRKIDDKIIKTSTINVGVKKHLYELHELNDDEVKLIQSFFISDAPNSTTKFQQSILDLYQLPFKLSEISSILGKEFPNFSKLKKNTIEEIHTQIELGGFKLINAKANDNFDYLKEPESRYQIILFLICQFLRTQKQMKNVLHSLENNGRYRAKNIWPLLSLIISVSSAHNIFFYKSLNYTFFVNKTDIHFITSEQPIINSSINYDPNDSGTFEFYFPINPRLALKINFGDEEDIKLLDLSEALVHKFNKLIFSNSEVVFSYDIEHSDWYNKYRA